MHQAARSNERVESTVLLGGFVSRQNGKYFARKLIDKLRTSFFEAVVFYTVGAGL